MLMLVVYMVAAFINLVFAVDYWASGALTPAVLFSLSTVLWIVGTYFAFGTWRIRRRTRRRREK